MPIRQTETLSLDKIPPQALDVERTVLGSMLIDSNAANNAMAVLTEDCFYAIQNQRVFSCMAQMFEKNIAIDVLTLADALKKKNWLESVGAEP